MVLRAALFAFLLAAAPAQAKEPLFRMNAPVVDAPFNFHGGYAFPNMAQSLSLSSAFYDASHYGLSELVDSVIPDMEQPILPGANIEPRPLIKGFMIAAFDILSFYVPLGVAWMHEEWHRAVLSRRQISSRNDIYSFPFFSETIAVSHVTDEELVRLKRENPADHVRLSAAGFEAELELNKSLERARFFGPPKPWGESLLLLNHFSNLSYLFTCASRDADRLTDKLNAKDGSVIPVRDFTGLDCTAWAYDLHRANEPYEARGRHPSGSGIARYRSFSGLTEEEQSYLRLQARLSLLSLINPALWGRNKFYTGTHEWSFALRYYLASFGTSLAAEYLHSGADWRYVFTLHNGMNHEGYFPGFELSLLETPWSRLGGDRGFRLESRVMGWLQPESQAFRSAVSRPGGLLSFKLTHPLGRFIETWVEAEAKTEGWVAGTPYLNSGFFGRVGLAFLVNQ